MELTKKEKERVQSIDADTPGGRKRYAGDMPDIDPDGDEPIQADWRVGGGVTQEMCNAIRCAAHDGVPYSRIAEMFTLISDRSHARQHATGTRCSHDGIKPVPEQRSKENHQKLVSLADCKHMRRRWKRGDWDSYRDAAEDLPVGKDAVHTHVTGDCTHKSETGNQQAQQPDDPSGGKQTTSAD